MRILTIMAGFALALSGLWLGAWLVTIFPDNSAYECAGFFTGLFVFAGGLGLLSIGSGTDKEGA